MARTTKKNVTLRAGQVLHVETPLGIVNIYAGLSDADGRSVDTVELIPTGAPRIPSNPIVIVDGGRFVQLLAGESVSANGAIVTVDAKEQRRQRLADRKREREALYEDLAAVSAEHKMKR